MAEEGDVAKRASSPLKRRASDMASDVERPTALDSDVEMTNAAPLAVDEDGNTGGARQQPGASEGVDTSDTSADVVMNGYVEDRGVRAMSIDPTVPQGVMLASNDQRSPTPPPPMREQIITIQSLLKLFGQEPLLPNTTVYCVSRGWLGRAMQLGDDSKDPPKDADAALEALGPVDNSDIILGTIDLSDGKTFVRFKEGVDLNEFEPFPLDAWETLVKWHGLKEGQQPITRQAVKMLSGDVVYENHPLILTVHLAWAANSPFEVDPSIKSPPIKMVVSRRERFQTTLRQIKTLLNVPMERKVRLWVVKPPPADDDDKAPKTAGALTPPASPQGDVQDGESTGPWGDLMVDAPTVLALDTRSSERTRVTANDETGNSNYNGSSTVDMFLDGDSILVVDAETGRDSFVLTHTSRSDAGTAASKIIANRGGGSRGIASAPISGRSSPTGSGPMTRGRAQKKRHGRGKGVVGFQNLGNTCYMNSALQCMRSVEELSKYFLSGEYKKEVNEDNPLGYGGAVAHSYGKLIKDVYDESRTSFVPKSFRNTVGNCRSQFASWTQQDSQEFLGFMLDALQEDLSRVKKKPYIEKPDSTDDMIDNPAAVKAMADKVWDITRLRDDSVIADLFTGMYKSTLKCPECDKISITFDPFNNLTLPLPVENMQYATVRFFPLNDAPIDMDVEVPKHSAITVLKQFISDRTGVPADRMIGAEEYQDRFFKVYGDADDVSEDIKTNDFAAFHELEAVPTNWPLPGNAKKTMVRSMLDVDGPPPEDPRCERMVIPVIHRMQANKTSRDSNRANSVSPPHFITVTREEAHDEGMIRRKILEKIATFSTWAVLRDDDSDLTVVSDAESLAGNTKADSVENEDDLVDVTMTTTTSSTLPLRRFNSKRPRFSDPKTFLDPELQGLFSLYFFQDDTASAAVPSGWTSLNSNSEYLPLSSRAPQPAAPDTPEEDAQSPSSGSNSSSLSGLGGESDGDANADTQESQTRMADESSDGDATPPPITRNHGNGHRDRGQKRGGKRFKPNKTYGKKGGNKRRDQASADRHFRNLKDQSRPRTPPVQPQPQPQSPSPSRTRAQSSTPGPLVRLGEGLVVEWSEDAWAKVYGGYGNSVDLRGSKTYTDPEKLRDVTLEQKRKARASRRNRGITLDECLDEFEKAEVLSAQDMWYCPRCKDHRRASKKFDLWKTPDILVCHLKRFSANRRDKLDVPVDFPVLGLDLTRRVVNREEDKEEVYDLIAVDDHYGGLGGGHYTAYARNFVDGRWYNYNDSSASARDEPQSAVSGSAYLLFYRRRSRVPLGGPRFADMMRQFDSSSDDDSGSGEDQRLVGASSRLGSSSAGKGAVAPLPRAGHRGLASSAISVGAGDDDDDDDDDDDGLPAYSAGVSLIVPQLPDDQDEGVDLGDQSGGGSIYQQSWGWDNTAADGAGGASLNDGDYPSDQAQVSDGEDATYAASARDGSLMDADDDVAGGFVDEGPRHVTDADFDDIIAAPCSPADPDVAEIYIDSNSDGAFKNGP